MNFFNIFKRKKKKINELSVFEEFRFELKKEERERVDSLKKDLKKQPFSTSGYLLIGAIVSPFAGEGKKFYSQTLLAYLISQNSYYQYMMPYLLIS